MSNFKVGEEIYVQPEEYSSIAYKATIVALTWRQAVVEWTYTYTTHDEKTGKPTGTTRVLTPCLVPVGLRVFSSYVVYV